MNIKTIKQKRNLQNELEWKFKQYRKYVEQTR